MFDLRAGAGLPDDERKLIVELAVGDVLRDGGYGAGEVRIEAAEIAIDLRRGAFDERRGRG